MKDENDVKDQTDAQKRKFLKQAGVLAVTAPAAGMILTAASKPALAQVGSGGGAPISPPVFAPPPFESPTIGP